MIDFTPVSGVSPPPSTARRADVVAMIAMTLDTVRTRRPRVHAITNPVAHQITANGLLALGAIPTLTANAREVEAFVRSSEAVLLNLGMMDRERFDSLPLAAAAAKAAGKPFVLDPAFADRSPERLVFAKTLLRSGPNLFKPNRRESELLSAHLPEGCVELITGPKDYIRYGTRGAILANGDPLLDRVTATGCLLGAILATCLAVTPDPFHAAIAGTGILTIASEIAAEGAAGPGSFAVRLLDALAALDATAIHTRLNLEMLRDKAP